MSETRELLVRRNDQGHCFIYREGGGPVPKELDGMYNKRRIALSAIDSYEYQLKQAKADEKQKKQEAKDKAEAAEKEANLVKAKDKAKKAAAKRAEKKANKPEESRSEVNATESTPKS